MLYYFLLAFKIGVMGYIMGGSILHPPMLCVLLKYGLCKMH